MGKIMQIFRRRQYRTIEDLVAHAREISEAIKPIEQQAELKRRKRDMTEEKKIFLYVLKRFKPSPHYDPEKIARKMLRIQRLNPNSPTWLRRRTGTARRYLQELVVQGKIPPEHFLFGKKVKPARQQVSEAEVTGNIGLVHSVLKRGHRYLAPSWRFALTYLEAVDAGKAGLKRGLELRDPKKSPKGTNYIMGHIAGAISGVVRKKRRNPIDTATVPIEWAEKSEIDRTQRVEPSEIKRQIEYLFAHPQARPEHAMMHLLKAAGHQYEYIAKHLGVNGEAVRGAHLKAIRILKEKFGKQFG